MRATILNREFKHPADGWYQIEPKGEHPNRVEGIIQVIDGAAISSIVQCFNADAIAGGLTHGHEMLIDHEHFKHEMDQETLAYGWLQQLQGREDGIYGRIRWTGTGQPAVDQGDYRFFSTEYDRADLAVLNSEGKLKRVRPTRLDGLTLTNAPNNKGGKPITNRGEFRGAGASADSKHQPAFADATARQGNQRTVMKSVATKLGLSADASEEAVLAEVTKISNRATEAEGQVAPMKTRVTELETANTALLGEQCDALMDAHGIKSDDKVRNRLRPILTGCKNREDRTEALVELGFEPVKPGARTEAAAAQTKLLNRNTRPPTKGTEDGEGKADQAMANKIMNRARSIQSEMTGVSMATAVSMAQKEVEAE